jgi:hypothetical protein
MQNEESFLQELTLLTRKYQIEISGCGHCGSPFLMGLLESEASGQYSHKEQRDDRSLDYNKPTNG